VAFLYATVGVSFLFGVALNGVRDRLDGGLEFLTSLPVTPRVAAAARLAACAAVAAPAAALLTVAVVLIAPVAPVAASPPAWIAACFLGTWSVGASGSALLLGMLLRFSQQALGRLPVALMAATFVVAGALERFAPEVPLRGMDLVREPWFPAALTAALLLAELGALLFAFRLLESGIRRFRPGKGSLTW
jgi:hypothetical protein